MPDLLPLLVNIVASIITAAGVIAILVAVLITAYQYWRGLIGQRPYPPFVDVRLRIGHGLVLALELFVGADLLRTVLTPTTEDLVTVSVIVVLRTIISLSLDYELRSSRDRQCQG